MASPVSYSSQSYNEDTTVSTNDTPQTVRDIAKQVEDLIQIFENIKYQCCLPLTGNRKVSIELENGSTISHVCIMDPTKHKTAITVYHEDYRGTHLTSLKAKDIKRIYMD